MNSDRTRLATRAACTDRVRDECLALVTTHDAIAPTHISADSVIRILSTGPWDTEYSALKEVLRGQ